MAFRSKFASAALCLGLALSGLHLNVGILSAQQLPAPDEKPELAPETDPKLVPKPEPETEVAPDKSEPLTKDTKRKEAEKPKSLDELFAELKRTADPGEANKIVSKIWQAWFKSEDETVNLLMGWANNAVSRQENGKALDLLDQVTTIAPDYAEGWNRRATLHYNMSNYSKSIRDIERTLALEPRHFGALSGLGTILQILDRKEEALATWYKVLEIYPSMKSAQEAVIKLEEATSGQGI